MRNSISYRTALILASAFLTCLGLLAIYASSSIPAQQTTGSEFALVKKQAVVAAFGFFFIFLTGHISFRWIERSTLPLLALSLFLLVLVQVPAFEGRAGGASRWIMIGGTSFQPGELAKLGLILFLAKNLSRTKCNVENFYSGVLPNLFVFFLFAFLLMIQPDLGTTALLFGVTFLMFLVAGLPRKYIYWFSGSAFLLLVAAVLAAPYRMARLFVFLDPWAEAKTGGFQIIQSYLGFQNGGLFGAGLGESRQKLFFLPDAHTDFILSVIGEELGLFGVIFVCALFAYIVYLGFKITNAQAQPYRKFVAFGLTSLIALQAILNMGVTMGMLPTKGIPLPFVSHGSSSLLVFLLVVAILARISQEAQKNNNAKKT